MSNKPKLVFLTGAGISKESGISTFRDSNDGLWNNYKIEDVSSLDGWRKDPQTVLNFYNDRRREVNRAKPNDAHKIIAKLEEFYDVTIITQNIDDLHERAGSSNVIHLHGEINKVREDAVDLIGFEKNENSYEWKHDLTLDDRSPNGYPMRPDVVWFGEYVKHINEAFNIVKNADAYIVIGTSLFVSPANMLHNFLSENCIKIQIDPEMVVEIEGFMYIQEIATIGVATLYDLFTRDNILETYDRNENR